MTTREPALPGAPRLAEFALGAGAVAATTLLVRAVADHIAESDRVMLFLLAVVLVAFRVALGPAIATALLSVAAYDIFFVEPYFTLAVDDGRYVITFAVMASLGVVLSSLSARLRMRERQAREAAARAAALSQLAHELVGVDDPGALAAIAAAAIDRAFDADITVVLRDSEGAEAEVTALGRSGRATAELDGDPIAGSEAIEVPLLGRAQALGAVRARARAPGGLRDSEARRLLDTFVGQVALALERARHATAHREAAAEAKAERLKSTLLASVSHDLRTPLGSIVGAATTLLDRDAHVEPELRRELLHSIHHEAERLARLLENLLTMTRIQGGLQLRREWQVPEEVIGAALQHLAERRRGREVRVCIAPEVELVAFDAVMIELALINLLDNAIKYSPAGAPIEVEVRREGSQTRFSILDRGPGVAAGERHRLFERTYRGDGAAGVAGAGLGLAIARAVVEAHGGAIAVEAREDGPGSAFSFALPTEGPTPAAGGETMTRRHG